MELCIGQAKSLCQEYLEEKPLQGRAHWGNSHLSCLFFFHLHAALWIITGKDSNVVTVAT